MATMEELQMNITAAEEEIRRNEKYYTRQSIREVRRLIDHAKKVLNGEYNVPFVRNRNFVDPEPGDDAEMALRKYVRVPGYDVNGNDAAVYGLENAVEWLRDSNIMNRLEYSAQLLGEWRKEIEKYPVGDVPGGISGQYKDDAIRAMDAIDGKTGEELGMAEVEAFNRLADALNSARLRSDIEKSSLFLTEDERESFIENIKSDKSLSACLEKIREYADRLTLDDVKAELRCMDTEPDFDSLNSRFYMWSTTDKFRTIESPEGAKYAEISFVLDSADNEEDGLGHVWIDDIRVYPQNGDDWNIMNSGFEDGDDMPSEWEIEPVSGKPIIRRETRYPFCGAGKASLYMENPTSNDSARAKHSRLIEVSGGESHTVTFMGKIDGKLKDGVWAVFDFYNDSKEYIGTQKVNFNRTSTLNSGHFALSMQCDAIMYYFTGNINYALKTKYEILMLLNDFNQGAEHWRMTDARPDGCDAYGGVQGGRIASVIAESYSLIKYADVFSEEEIKIFMAQLDYFIDYLWDLRPRIELNSDDVQKWAGNWQTDMACGTAMLAMAVPEWKYSREYMVSACYFLKCQLTEHINPDGSFPESMRYHMATLSRYAVYAKAVKNCTGDDLFSILVNMFSYPACVCTPEYDFNGGSPDTPVFGDHSMSCGQCFDVFGLYYGAVGEYDKNIAAMMYDTWKRAGKPRRVLNSENIIMENLFAPGENVMVDTDNLSELKSTGDYSYIGTYVIRGRETYLAATAPRVFVGHGHYDMGSFVLMKNGIPLVIDPGIESYFDRSKDWYVSSSSHSVVQFERSGGRKTELAPFDINLLKTEYSAAEGWNDTERTVKSAEFINDSDREIICIVTENSDKEAGGEWTRKIEHIKSDDRYIIEDVVEDFSGKLRWSLVTAMLELTVNGNHVYGKGRNGIDLDIVFDGELPEISIERGRCQKQFECSGTPYASILRAVGKKGFRVEINIV